MLFNLRAMYALLGVVHVLHKELHAGDSSGCIWVEVTHGWCSSYLVSHQGVCKKKIWNTRLKNLVKASLTTPPPPHLPNKEIIT